MPANDAHPIDKRIRTVNQRLKNARLSIQLERRGQKINLRGTLPPRPESHRVRPHQQRISLGLPATAEGLKAAEQQAKVIAAQIIQGTFDWNAYLPVTGGGRLHQMNLTETLEAFRQHFMTQPQRLDNPASAQATWETAYAPYFRKLEAIAHQSPQLNLAEAVYKTIESTPVNSRSRQLCCTSMSILADFLDIPLSRNLKDYWGHYSPSQTRMRNLPTDERIVEVYQTIPNEAWRFVYGMMATYGLRNHEVFFCDYSRLRRRGGDRSIEVLDTTKTGSREVWPFYPEWVDEFGLSDGELPPINTDLETTTLQRIGQKVSAQLRRYALPFNPYDLRHAWAVRTIHFGLADTVAAQMMGHSVSIHTRTYHRWLTRRDQQQAVDTALERTTLTAPSLSP